MLNTMKEYANNTWIGVDATPAFEMKENATKLIQEFEAQDSADHRIAEWTAVHALYDVNCDGVLTGNHPLSSSILSLIVSMLLLPVQVMS